MGKIPLEDFHLSLWLSIRPVFPSVFDSLKQTHHTPFEFFCFKQGQNAGFCDFVRLGKILG